MSVLKKLDRFYIPTRYPNGLPEGTPHQNYTREDADFALRLAEEIMGFLSR
ncbi:MAG: HEPN domain-containing protein [Candidatus Hydrogenedentota bacterium]|nr:MAG: HEPN domain-containing protein [Candidatus Hydrogenedentota bacterium]